MDGHSAHQAAGAGLRGWRCVRRGSGRGQGSQQTRPSPQRLRGSEGPGLGRGAGLSLAPLNLGDAETGFLTQSNLLNVAGRLGPDWPAVALHLGLSYQELQRIRHKFRWVPLSRRCRPPHPHPHPGRQGDPHLRLAEVPSRGGGSRATGRKGMVWSLLARGRGAGPWVWSVPGLGLCHHASLPRDDLDGQIRHMLFSWAERQAGQPGAVGRLVQALEQSDRRDVAQEVRAILELGRRKYQDGIRHTSLAPGDDASPGASASQPPEPAQAQTC